MTKPFEVSEAVRAGSRVVTVRGELDLNGADDLKDPLERAAIDPTCPLVIDLSDCTFIDSTGLATIVHVTRPVRDGGPGVTLVCREGEVRKLLELAALDLTFPIVDRLENGPGAPPASS